MKNCHYFGEGFTPCQTVLENRACIGRSSYEAFTGSTLRHSERQIDLCVSESHLYDTCRDSNPDLQKYKKPPQPSLTKGGRRAFTLAEVLITLGIIGVVAALTMPTLISNHRKKEVETKLAKVYSVMNQAIKLTNNEFGEPADWMKDCGISTSVICTTDEALEWFSTHIGKYLQYTKIEADDENKSVYIYLNDGSILYMRNSLYDYTFFINKKAVENSRSGINTFNFRFKPILYSTDSIENNKYAVGSTFEPYAYSWNGTRDGLIDAGKANDPRYICGSESNAFCAKLIQYEGWKIPDDYPFKF